MKSTILRSASLLIIMLAVSCSYTVKGGNALINRLNNRGPVALSSDNPYLAANLLLSKEMENSSDLRGFIEHRGAPAALEVESKYTSPLLLYLYYPENRETYTAEYSEGSWIISGPNPVPQEKLKAVAKLTRNIVGEPKLIEPPRSAPLPAVVEVEPSPTAVVLNKAQVPVPIKSNNSTKNILVSDDPRDVQQAVEELLGNGPQHLAEITPRGDIVHYVTFPGESLSAIARWYTYDRENVSRIARINGLSAMDKIKIGDAVVIPGYLVKNKQRLSQEGLQLLSRSGLVNAIK